MGRHRLHRDRRRWRVPGLEPLRLLVDLIYALKAGYRQNAVFVMNRKTQAAVRKFKDSTGAYLGSRRLSRVSAAKPTVRLVVFCVAWWARREDAPLPTLRLLRIPGEQSLRRAGRPDLRAQGRLLAERRVRDEPQDPSRGA